ncbi:MAG: hypothetical protein GQ574_13250 [Crocinitomix sp.]|nr:hypothetical protein [Crocinitomix sp.]
MKTKIKKIFKWGIYYPLLTFVCFELALLILGYRRYQTVDYQVDMQPEYAYLADDSLGIALKPGDFSITLNNVVHFDATHTNESMRYTPRMASDSIQKNISFLGCSFTYGYGVNDNETFVAELQQENPQWFLQNQGVIGYGTVQSLLQLQTIIDQGETEAVLLNFSSFHFMRNSLSQTYRKNLKLGYAHSSKPVDSIMSISNFPYINSCNCAPQFANWSEMHENWAGREYFASINWIQTLSEQYKDSKLDEVALTTCLFEKMHKMCKEANISFGIVCLDATAETEALHANLPTMPWLDVNFDFEDSTKTFIPHDSHPNAAGHHLIADKIAPFLTNLLLNE